MRIRRSHLIAALVAVAAVVSGIVLWPHADDADAPSRASEAPHAVATRSPRWLEQAGVGGRRIAGIVLGDDGSPVRGATVRIASPLTMADASTEPSAVTDAAGAFDFGPRPAMAYLVVAEAPRLASDAKRIDLRDPTMTPEDLRLVLHACDTSIHGTVRDGAGGVIAGAVVGRSDAGISTGGGVESDASGSYELCIPAQTTSVTVKADGYAAMQGFVSVYGRTRRDFVLGPGTSVSGRVVRAADRSAVTGAIVELRPADPTEFRPMPLFAFSDAEGRFQLDGVAPGRHRLRARAARLASAHAIEAIVEIGKMPDDIICELVSTASVSGKVVERDTRAPVAGEHVVLMAAGLDPQRLDAITQTDGSFVIEHVLPGELVPMLEDESVRQQPVTVTGADVAGLVLEIEPRTTISGRVTYEGKPVAGARVVAGDRNRAETDFEGRYTVRVSAGDYAMGAESMRVGAFTRAPAVTVAKGEHRKGVDLELTLAASIAGVVVDQNDVPLEGATLTFSLLHGRDFGVASTADDGSFTARAMAGGGDYVYEVRRAASSLVYPPTTGKRFPPITVRDGQTHITGLRVKVHVERFVIAGHVTDSAGKPIPDVVVRAAPAGHGAYGTVVTTDEAGAFTLRDLGAGAHRVEATSGRGQAEVTVAAGRRDVVMQLGELGAIEGTIEGDVRATEVLAYNVRQRGSLARGAVTDNHFTIRNLVAGSYIVSTSTKALTTEVVTVASGEAVKVTLRKREFGVIVGTVVDEKSRAARAGFICSQDQSESAPTDASGRFRIEHAVAGKPVVVACHADNDDMALGPVTVTPGAVTTVELVVRPKQRRGHAGLAVETQLGEIVVKTVEPGGPAARAGIRVGDVVMKIDGEPIDNDFGEMVVAQLEGSVATRKLTLERADKELTVELIVEPAR